MSTNIQLGDVIFEHAEVPEKINFGGIQDISMKKTIGGQRRVQSLGRDDDPIAWEGIFFGDTAFERAKLLDSMRVEGKSLNFTFFDRHYLVVISEFRPQLEAEFQIPYSISLLVIDDLNIVKKESFVAKLWDDVTWAIKKAVRTTYPLVKGHLLQIASFLEGLPTGVVITPKTANELREKIKNAAVEVEKAIKNELGKGL